MIAALLSIMTPYEWARVLINFGQLVAMIIIPFIVLKYKIKFTISNEEQDDKKDNK